MMRLFSHSRAAYAARENQDYIGVRRARNGRLVALADGQGGREGGALAARVAVRSALDWLETAANPDSHRLRTAISVADEAVEEHEGAGYATLILLACEGDQIVGASVGDSMALHFSSNGLVELSKGQRKNPPLGSGAAMGVPFSARPQVGEQILLMSDGVFRFVSLESIEQTCRGSDDFAVIPGLLALQKRSDKGDLPDDWSAMLLRF